MPLPLADAVVDVVKHQSGSVHDQFFLIVGGGVVQHSHASAATASTGVH